MFDYYGPRGPIDLWYGTFTRDDAIKNIIKFDTNLNGVSEDLVDSILRLANAFHKTEDSIKLTLRTKWQEEPHTIRYWTFPLDFEMTLCAIAKIDNNGETFVFTNEKEILEMLGIDIYDVIKADG